MISTTGQEVVRAREEEPFLERFIEAYQPFILRTASRYAGFCVTRSDDEFSIALLAFYEAVRQYDPAGGSFGAFAALVIRHRLADYYRALRHFEPEIPLSPQVFDGGADRDGVSLPIQLAVSAAMARGEGEGVAGEIEAANRQLQPYGFCFADLAACAPRAEKSRRACARAAATLAQDTQLLAALKRQQRLPVKRLSRASHVPPHVIERHRRFIIAAALLLGGNYPRLRAYLEPCEAAARAGKQKD